MIVQRKQLEQRRRQLQNRMPEHFCHQCTAVVYVEDEACLECAQARPEQGWMPLSDSMDPWLGRVLAGRYLLTKCIGQGASASVYRAESLAISRQFAIKIIHPSTSSKGPTPEQIAQRLEREIDALGRLRNPHIVRFYDVIELPLHHIGVVMDFVEGETIESLVERSGPLKVSRAISLLRQIANGIYEAHLAGMTHRDLKPENLMVERLPVGDEFVHILDFGIVYVDGSVGMTQGFIGTPLYASPEQALGEPLDFRSDIYSLGAIFFFMLTGRPPFVGSTVMQVLRQHVESVPMPLGNYRKDVKIPKMLETLVGQMLAKEVEHRPDDLSSVIAALDSVMGVLLERERTSGKDIPKVNKLKALSDMARSSEGSETVVRGGSSVEVVGRTDQRMPNIVNTSELSVVSEALERNTLNEPTHPGLPGSQEIALTGTSDIDVCSGSRNFRFVFFDGDDFRMHHLLEPRPSEVFKYDSKRTVCSMVLGQKSMFIGCTDGSIEQINLQTKSLQVLFESVFPSPVVGIASGQDDKLLLAGMANGRLYLSHAHKDNKDWVRIRSAGGTIEDLVLSPRSDLFAVGRDDGVIEVSRLAEPKHIHMTIDVGQGVRRMAFSDDSYLLGALLADHTFSIYQLINGKELINISLPQLSMVYDVFFSPETNKIIGYFRIGNTLYAVDIQQVDGL